jgi:hypothetical protein
LLQLTEYEVLNVTGKLKGKFSAGWLEIPERLLKESIQYIKKPLTFIFNISLGSGTFPNLMMIAKVSLFLKKKGNKKFPIIDQLQFCQFFPNFLYY